MVMDSPSKTKKSSLSSNVFFLFILLNTNLLTLFLSNFYNSSSNCSFNPTTPTTITTATTATTVATTKKDAEDEEPRRASPSTITVVPDLPPEFLSFTSPHILRFGVNRNFDSDTLYPPVGSPCTLFPDELRRYMTYKVNGSCPDDELLAQKLLMKGCEPLPRRRCRPAAPKNYVEPFPLPKSLWSTPSDSSVVWTAYTCKNYTCLIHRKQNHKGFDDCMDCFDLGGLEKNRWASSNRGGGIVFTIDEVLATKKPGTIRIGLDLGGGVATFAVRMKDKNITIITTSMNLNGPFNTFIASRGVVPMYISISQRLPFFDNTMDIIHSMHVLSNWIPTNLMHFIFFDIYRILRPGGLFWLDHFFCMGDELEHVYTPLIDSIGFNKLKWVVGKKLDHGPEKQEKYLSALLEKPLMNSW